MSLFGANRIRRMGSVASSLDLNGSSPIRKTIVAISLFSASLIVPFVALCAVLGYNWVRVEQEHSIARLSAVANTLTGEVDRVLGDHIAVLQVLATSPALEHDDFSRFGDQARTLKNHRGLGIILREPDGQVRIDTLEQPIARRQEIVFSSVLRDGEPEVSDLVEQDAGRPPVVALNVPVMHDGRLRFVLSAIIRSVAFNDMLRRSGLTEEQFGTITDRQGRVIGRSMTSPMKVGEVVQGFADRTSNYGLWTGVDGLGQSVRVEYRRLGIGWLVNVGMTQAAFRAPLVHSLWVLAGLTLALALGALLLTLPIVRRMLADVTARRETEEALRASEAQLRIREERLALALDNSEDGLYDWDLASDEIWVSERWLTKVGTGDRLSRTGEDFINTVHPNDRDAVRASLQAHLSGITPTFEAEYQLQRAAGSYFWALNRARVVSRRQDGRPLRLVGTMMDITRRKEAEMHVVHMAHHDALTDLPNRNLFQRHLDHTLTLAARKPGHYAVLACDLDRFKSVNDTFGHPAGDRLLCAAAERICAIVRDRDVVSRLGGDEFAVILADIDHSQVEQISERIIAAFGEPILLNDIPVHVGISIGAALMSGDGASADEIFKRADTALYQAKAAGRNTYRLFDAGVHARTVTRSLIALDMKEAIRRGEFFLMYQPVIDVTTNAVVSFEALMRWRHHVHGLISPGDFIPVAEETGLITPLGAWALAEACREALSWPETLRVGVNVSAVQFRGGLEQAVMTALASSGLAAQRLKLEVTESVLMQDADDALACLHRLRGFGVKIALDDFGTGYSSLSYLRRFPFDKLKIDRAFVHDIADPDAAAIIRAVVSIGERLGMGIVAEGVETEEQLELVRREGCTEVQGFYFSKPLAAAEARAFVTTYASRVA